MQSQQCQKCALGTYSLGTGVAFEEWDSMPPGFVTHGVTTNGGDALTDCSKSVYASLVFLFKLFSHCFLVSRSSSNCFWCWCFFSSTWTPMGDYVTSNTDECTATLSYAVSLKQPGTVSFEYLYPDNSLYFEFFVSVLKWLWVKQMGDFQRHTEFGHLWLVSHTAADSEWPVSVYGLKEPVDEDLWEKLQQIQGSSPLNLLAPCCHLQDHLD